MSGYTIKIRNHFSTWLNLAFLLLLATFLVFIEFFLDANTEKSVVQLLENPIRSDIIPTTKSIEFTNRLGTFVLKKQNNSWLLIEPRVIPAKEQTISTILTSIENISIKTIHQLEPINIQSFSLNNPVMTIKLITKLDELIEVKVGLINPIDETSYMTVSGHNRIYQTDLSTQNLEGFDLADFIDANVFSSELNQIRRFEIFRGNESKSWHSFTVENNLWSSNRYNSVSQDKIGKVLQSILNIKTHKIIDQMNEELKNLITNYLENPQFTIKLVTNSGKEITYKITYLLKELKELKIEKKSYVIISASDRPYPYIVHKKFLEDLIIKYQDIRP